MELLCVGRVGKPHGLKGEIKVKPETEDPHRLVELESVFVGATAATSREFRLQSVRVQPFKSGWTVLMSLAGVESIEAAESLRGQLVYARSADLPPMEEGEWLIDELVGLNVVLESGEQVGTVKEVLELPAHPTLVIDRPDAEDVLVPAISPFLVEVNVAEGRIQLSPIEGLLD